MLRINRVIASLFIAHIVLAALCSVAQAQSTASQKLARLRAQNAYQQQQAALQLAIQQTNLLIQRANRQNSAIQPTGFFAPINFGPQQAALQFALQQSTMASQPSATGLQSTVSVSSAIQSAIQTSALLQTGTQLQSGQLTFEQIQSLFNEQAALTNLLAVPISSR
jgi:hypothetical protein